jgi:3',5'-cyclic AMP phosphodiesterase CpdA
MIIASDIHARTGKPLLVDRLRSELEKDKQRTLILAGDFTHKARDAEYERIEAWIRELLDDGVNVVLSVGNHDMSTSIGIARIPNQNGYERYSNLLDVVEEQSIVVARMDEFDVIYKVGMDVFYAARSTHSKIYKGSRIKEEQLLRARWHLENLRLLPQYGYRLHLLTHHSLWKLDDDAHGHLNRRKRLVKEILRPLCFSTAINGHNHRFDAAIREVKDLRFWLYHIQAPTLSTRTKGKFTTGFVKWDTEIPGSAVMVSVSV